MRARVQHGKVLNMVSTRRAQTLRDEDDNQLFESVLHLVESVVQLLAVLEGFRIKELTGDEVLQCVATCTDERTKAPGGQTGNMRRGREKHTIFHGGRSDTGNTSFARILKNLSIARV